LGSVKLIAAGDNHSIALKNDGTVVAWGDHSEGQTNVPITLCGVKLIAAGGNHSLAAVFSPTVQYAVNVTNDLLLIYNTNSTDSATVFNYYLQHRPMIGGANVLGIACSTNEIVVPGDFSNQVLAPYLSWMAQNPTKRPQYVVLFLDIPSRVEGSYAYPSVQYQISEAAPGIKPFLSSININGTNDCIAYISKLALFGSNYSPGKSIISASAGGYGNTNYVVDSIRHGTGHVDDYTGGQAIVSTATNGLLASGVLPSAILYADGVETIIGGVTNNLPHLTNASNVAGYISWGAHSSLGGFYAVSGTNGVYWNGNSGWWVVQTVESFNGQRQFPEMGYFIQWFSSRCTPYFQAVGDPLVVK
jgi:Regulator of chromosome condensation (RCC1) repeat